MTSLITVSNAQNSRWQRDLSSKRVFLSYSRISRANLPLFQIYSLSATACSCILNAVLIYVLIATKLAHVILPYKTFFSSKYRCRLVIIAGCYLPRRLLMLCFLGLMLQQYRFAKQPQSTNNLLLKEIYFTEFGFFVFSYRYLQAPILLGVPCESSHSTCGTFFSYLRYLLGSDLLSTTCSARVSILVSIFCPLHVSSFYFNHLLVYYNWILSQLVSIKFTEAKSSLFHYNSNNKLPVYSRFVCLRNWNIIRWNFQ